MIARSGVTELKPFENDTLPIGDPSEENFELNECIASNRLDFLLHFFVKKKVERIKNKYKHATFTFPRTHRKTHLLLRRPFRTGTKHQPSRILLDYLRIELRSAVPSSPKSSSLPSTTSSNYSTWRPGKQANGMEKKKRLKLNPLLPG